MDITKLVASIFRVPACGVALVDETRVWYKVGAQAQHHSTTGCSCSWLPLL